MERTRRGLFIKRCFIMLPNKSSRERKKTDINDKFDLIFDKVGWNDVHVRRTYSKNSLTFKVNP